MDPSHSAMEPSGIREREIERLSSLMEYDLDYADPAVDLSDLSRSIVAPSWSG